MAKFWKELIGGQIKNGIYDAGPRHASQRLGSFASGNPPRLPFQYIVHFDINANVLGTLVHGNEPYSLAQMVKTIDMPSMSVTVEKRPTYNKNTPCIITKIQTARNGPMTYLHMVCILANVLQLSFYRRHSKWVLMPSTATR